MLLHTCDLLLAYLKIVSMFKNRLEVVENLMQIMHITLLFMCKYRWLTFQVWFWLFWTFCVSGFFLRNRVATLVWCDVHCIQWCHSWAQLGGGRVLPEFSNSGNIIYHVPPHFSPKVSQYIDFTSSCLPQILQQICAHGATTSPSVFPLNLVFFNFI